MASQLACWSKHERDPQAGWTAQERSEILEMMTTLQLAGMRSTYDEIVSVGIKRQHGIKRVIGALLKAEIAAKQARSINYQMGIAKLPLVKELADLERGASQAAADAAR
jgi:hypothetical protein